MLEATRSEAGCVQFYLFISDCGRYIFPYEEWEKEAALNNHHQEDHTKMVAQQVEHWLAAPTEVTLMKSYNKSHQYAACGRRTPLLLRHGKGATVLNVMWLQSSGLPTKCDGDSVCLTTQ